MSSPLVVGTAHPLSSCIRRSWDLWCFPGITTIWPSLFECKAGSYKRSTILTMSSASLRNSI